MAGVIKGATKVVVTINKAGKQRRLKEKKEMGSRPKRGEKEGGRQATGKRPRDDDDGLISEALMGKRRALEEAHQDVMGAEPRLSPFDLRAPPKLPFGREKVFAEGMKRVDFGGLCRQKKEVSLAMHQHEVPLVFRILDQHEKIIIRIAPFTWGSGLLEVFLVLERISQATPYVIFVLNT